MLKEVVFYYFSPTGGTKKVGEILCKALAEKVVYADLAEETQAETAAQLAVVAAPVYAGRIPAFAAEKIKALKGSGKAVVTLAVYGNRAYDDALLELNSLAAEAGFKVAGAAAAVAKHSIVTSVASSRPDPQDAQEIAAFAQQLLLKLEKGTETEVKVPGNHPYKDGMKVAATPICTQACGSCGHCAQICPTKAISVTAEGVQTQLEKCMLCVACVAHCPAKARILPPPMQENMNAKLGHLEAVRNKNEFYL